nr:terminase family protein [Sphingomonas faeni]
MVRLVAADNRIVQCAAVRKDGWTKVRREGFFAMLSATCNVRASAAAMGMTDCGAYYVRRRDPVFAAQWQEALAEGYSAEAPEALRGPEHLAAWCDEVAKWRNGDATWDNLMMGLRLGDLPRIVVTTTPRPVALLRRILALPGVVRSQGRTRDNVHLPVSFVEAVTATYAGTRLGRQELDGELIEDVAGALWTRELVESRRVAFAPAVTRVVVGVDPPAGSVSGGPGDACGIVAVALGGDGLGYVLEDASVCGASPEGWARAVAACAARHGADRVIAEGLLSRFDPRFWTVDFPRPMMASVVTTGPASLRVDAVFYKADDLAGVIWEAIDRFDHPLLQYETSRDFRDCRLRFRWRSDRHRRGNRTRGRAGRPVRDGDRGRACCLCQRVCPAARRLRRVAGGGPDRTGLKIERA